MPDAETRKSVTLSREELYALVWATPMSRLAIQYGLSGNGLAKICRRLDVPYPPRGYWARREAGKKVIQAALPAISSGTRAQVTIAPSLPASLPPQMPSELEGGLATARRLTAALRVPSKLHQPHRVVAGWIEERQREREQAKRYSWSRGGYVPPDFTMMERRRHRLLSTLFIALEKHGYTAKVDERGRPAVEIARQVAALVIKEKYRHVRQPLTEEDKKRGFNPKRPWRQEMQPTGLLQLSIEPRPHPTLRHSWIDAADELLEAQLPEIAAVFIAAAPILQERRRQYEENERRRHEEEMRRYKERQRQQLERNRLRGFLELASRWRQVEDARQFLNALASRAAEEPGQAVGDLSLDESIAWARERLTGRDPLEAGLVECFRQSHPSINGRTVTTPLNFGSNRGSSSLSSSGLPHHLFTHSPDTSRCGRCARILSHRESISSRSSI
ncbi:hypothetical protein GGD63_006940 [Bradyrhizobium sp. cir1]|uniref:hypothetical protein n=1 Tax=Bradyrhizobium sp. cir1 TaxID=1445730 RepID=UPI001605881C|nr:hypothetical protein [Bradyrhizobium sp. cir1]MBB4374111.1 hypothetical protein [Bradyrhizobium sp. cir1]